MIPTAIYVVAVPWTGIYLSSLILIALLHAMARPLQHRDVRSRSSIGVTVAIYLMFEKWFLVPLPKGPIEDFFGL